MKLFLCKILLRVLYRLTPPGYSMRCWRWKAQGCRPAEGDAQIRDCPDKALIHWSLRRGEP